MFKNFAFIIALYSLLPSCLHASSNENSEWTGFFETRIGTFTKGPASIAFCETVSCSQIVYGPLERLYPKAINRKSFFQSVDDRQKCLCVIGIEINQAVAKDKGIHYWPETLALTVKHSRKEFVEALHGAGLKITEQG